MFRGTSIPLKKLPARIRTTLEFQSTGTPNVQQKIIKASEKLTTPLTPNSLPYKVEKIDISKNTQKEDWVSTPFPQDLPIPLTIP
jgi:glutathione S-transferase